jgi:hypothetical protein
MTEECTPSTAPLAINLTSPIFGGARSFRWDLGSRAHLLRRSWRKIRVNRDILLAARSSEDFFREGLAAESRQLVVSLGRE